MYEDGNGEGERERARARGGRRETAIGIDEGGGVVCADDGGCCEAVGFEGEGMDAL